MKKEEIKIEDFLNERTEDIQKLEKAINGSKKKSLLFQRLPFYKRRRTRSNIRKKMKRCRKRQRHILKTHVWYAKRFKMIKINNISLPLALKTEIGIIEIIITNNFLIEFLPEFFGSSDVEACLSLIKVKNNLLEQFSDNIEHDLINGIPCFIKSSSEFETGKILLKKCDVMDIWKMMIKNGVIPICIEELYRISIENKFMIFPFDDINSFFYKHYEDKINDTFLQKYHRTPASKKVKINEKDLYIYTLKKIYYYIFELKKGVLSKNAVIYDKTNLIIGKVIRGSFCFTSGRSRGICYLNILTEQNFEFKAKNYNSDTIYNLIILKQLKFSGVRTRASEENGTLSHRLRPLGHLTSFVRILINQNNNL
ncbi:hydrolase (alpha beta hydrolase superfamily) [Vairimorpha apis BRL 01]|uniref:Hydrolase (Alpha beta hydrolase superfamily) n=1 Tax=Vairimorpha apis BRL 01 TaxID=1037528 RepID=T0L8U1_9MICR|nr:hydrolase (alpha beta hydrolase superfamily) [Vairimorpha apis BRL 01]